MEDGDFCIRSPIAYSQILDEYIITLDLSCLELSFGFSLMKLYFPINPSIIMMIMVMKMITTMVIVLRTEAAASNVGHVPEDVEI